MSTPAQPSRDPSVTIVGGGLVGALLATLLARQGHPVSVYEKRPDPRRAGFLGGRSINLALAERGLRALRRAGLEQAVREQVVMMRGRMVHDRDGTSALQRYGVDDSEVIWSVSRGDLNVLLLDAAERAGARLRFGTTLVDADFDRGRARFDCKGEVLDVRAPVLIGADGAGSALRAAMMRVDDLGERIVPLGHGYRELEIPALAEGPGAPFRIEPHALHIWPRGEYMCIALPNAGGSFTVTLFLRNDGASPSFARLPDAAAARPWFRREFPDLLGLMPGFDADFDAHPVGHLATLYLDRWHLGGRAVLLGDAAHALVPFHGQGMNAGFEDAVALADAIGAAGDGDLAAAFASFQRERKPNADAIAAMALENYVEMRDSVVDPDYLRRRALATALAERAPQHFMPRYRMVTFTHLPYAYARQRGAAQDVLLRQLLAHGDPVDLDAAVATLRATLPPLPELRHG